MDVGGWLRGLGLGQYEEKFRDNKIDADLLPRLTVDDLKDIGVSVVGDRRRLLDAIAVIAGAGRPADVPASPTKSAPSKGLQASAERRPITVMFCDLVGSTSLAAKLDAEDWRNIVNAYLDEASAAVTGLGGHVLKKLGDGLMALFGYPHAQENDAERAVRAALTIQRALSDLNARNADNGAPELSARIGIECGSVVVDATGEVFGEAPNVAARVQAAAEPGSILVTGSVQRQVAGLFVVEEKGAHELKGVAEPQSLYRVVRASGGGRRGGARALTSFVGREEDIGTLLRRWDRVRAGEGQFVLIVGEPGLGKSRLIEEFHTRLGETPHTWTECSSSQLLQNTPLHPLAEWGRLRFGEDLPAEQRLADLENTLRLVGLDVGEYAPLIAPLVDIPLPKERAAKFAPEELRRRQLAAVTAWFLAGARTQPVVLAFEDLHWADPTSLDLIQSLAERGAQAPLLVVATTRPEFRAPWGMRSHHAVVALAPLDRTEVRRMVGDIAAQHALPQEVVERVSERTGGVPLFVEEVTRLLVERGEQGGVQAIPPTLQQSLAARLDRLGPAREVAQVGAVLGRDFVYALLRDVAGLDESALQPALERLTEADLLFVEGAPPEAKYRFKHALIQDAAYDSLLKSRRQALHRGAAEALVEAKGQPEAIAHHFTEAGLDDLAIEWWGKAGDQALRRSAFQEAIAHLGKAIAMADKAGATAQQATGRMAAVSQRLPQLHAAYGNALIAARGHGAPETMEAFARARKSASGNEDAPGRLAADYGLWVGSYVRGDLPSMRTHAAAFLAGVAARPDSPEAGVAHRVVGTTHCFAGEYAEARDHLECALTLFQPGRDDDLAFRFGQDAGVAAMCYLAIASWPLGNVGRAVSLVDGAHERLASVAHVGTHAYTKLHSAAFELMRGDRARAAQNGSEAARIAREHDLPLWQAFGAFYEGLATAELGALSEGLSDMRRSAESLRQQNLLNFDGLLKIALADTETRAGDHDRAIAILDEALAIAYRLGYRAFEAELHRARGEILLARNPANPAPAEKAFLTAIAVAKQQGTRSFELRAALALAKMYQSTSSPVEAHAVLAPALEGFAPTTEMQEIAEAQALLAALPGTEEVKNAAASRQRRLQLQTSYSKAVMLSRGFGSEDAKAAFTHTQELASAVDNAAERFDAYYGLYMGSLMRGELRSARETSENFLSEAEKEERMTEAAAARRSLGLACLFQGELAAGRAHFEQVLRIFDPERDREAKFRFGPDAGVSATVYLALANWLLGEAGPARNLIEEAIPRAVESAHAPTLANAYYFRALFDGFRDDAEAARRAADSVLEVSRAHGLGDYQTVGALLSGWARARLGDRATGITELRQALAAYAGQGNKLLAPFFQGWLAEFEAAAQDTQGALARIDEALALAQQTGEHWTDAFLHRIRGDILLKADPENPARAEEAYRTAIAVAGEQGARSFGLRAALALAKLCQSTGRAAEAHAVLAPALEGFAPTPEMPEIAEAAALLTALAETDEVKSAAAARQRRLELQTRYGQAVMWSKGFQAEETKEAFARARELMRGAGSTGGPFATYYGTWVGQIQRAEIGLARQTAETFRCEAEPGTWPTEASVALRILGLTNLCQGDIAEASARLEQALNLSDPERDPEAKFHFGVVPAAGAMIHLALARVLVGEVREARALSEEAAARAAESDHAPTKALIYHFKALIDICRDDAEAALHAARVVLDVSREHGLALYLVFGELPYAWALARLGDRMDGAKRLRQALAAYVDRGNRWYVPFFQALLAEVEAERQDDDGALSRIEGALALANATGERWTDAMLHRIRGEILLKRDPANPSPAEEAFLTAIAVAQRQGTRAFGLRAALSLAKLYQATARPAEAHAVLSSALEGFSPTSEMPEIAEAKALLVAIEAGAHV